MKIVDRSENAGGGGYSGFGSGYGGLFLLAIFFVVLFGMFRGGNAWAGSGCGNFSGCGEVVPKETCADKITMSRFANFMDPEVSRTHEEIIRQAGAFEKQQATDTGMLKCEMLQQTQALTLGQERNTWAIINNANTIARDQERSFWAARMEDANRREAEAREKYLVLEGRLLATEQAREADKRQMEIMGQFCNVNNRITQIEGFMPRTAPCYIPSAPAATFVCGPRECSCNG